MVWAAGVDTTSCLSAEDGAFRVFICIRLGLRHTTIHQSDIALYLTSVSIPIEHNYSGNPPLFQRYVKVLWPLAFLGGLIGICSLRCYPRTLAECWTMMLRSHESLVALQSPIGMGKQVKELSRPLVNGKVLGEAGLETGVVYHLPPCEH